MRAAAVVGRIGALAVALGVGAALTTGVASADLTSPDSPDTTSVSPDASPDSSPATPPAGKSLLDDSSWGSTRAPASTPTSKRGLQPGNLDVGGAIRRFVDRGVVLSTGGALSSTRTTRDAAKTPTAQPADDPPAADVTIDETAKATIVGPADAASVATVRAESRPRKVSDTFDLNVAQPPTIKPLVRAGVRVPERVPEKTVLVNDAGSGAAKDAVGTVAQLGVDTVAAARSAQAPVEIMRAAEPFESLAGAAVATSTADAVAPVTRVLSGVLAAFGFSPQSVNAPVEPVQPVALLALMALGSRRELEQSSAGLARTSVTSTSSVPTATLAARRTAAVTTPATIRIGWVTGANSINDTVRRFGIAGTDVGVMWDNGVTGDDPATEIVERREVLMAFGDTFSGPNMTGVWRNNVLLRSADGVLSDGLYVPDGIIHDPGAYSGSPMTNPNFSREIIGKYGYAVGPEVTIIPTAAISVPGAGVNGATRQYIMFMSVRSWDTPGRWTTNYSGIAYSDDNGQNWRNVPASSIRAAAPGRSTMPYVAGNENFQQAAFVQPPAGSPEAAAGWVYMYGTPAGRGGTVYLSRVNEMDILDQTKYQYWDGSNWVNNKPSAAKPLLPAKTTTSFFGLIRRTTYPSAGEMSVQYNPYLKQYVMLYTDEKNNVVMRTSPTPQGTWSAPKTLVTSTQYPGLYAPMIHPWSGTDQLKKPDGSPEDPQYLYWGLSQWNEYNVALMRTDLSRV